MSMALLIISVALAILVFRSQRFRILGLTIIGLTLLSAVLNYCANIETEEQLQLADQ